MGLFVSTTGTDVAISELGITIPDPTTDYDLSGQFDSDDIKIAASLTTAIRNGTLVWRKVAAGAVQPPTDYDEDFLDIENENLGLGLVDDRTVTFKDLNSLVATSASPGYSFGDSGNISNAFLLRPGGAPSNKTGINLGLSSAVLSKITCGSQNIDTYDIEIYQHDGGGINMTLITVVSIVSLRKKEFGIADIYPLSNAIQQNRHVAVKITNGTAKNPGVDLQFSGSTA